MSRLNLTGVSLSLSLLAALCLLVPSLAAAEPGLGFIELGPAVPEATPPLPNPDVYPTQLVIDDDSAEGAFGFLGGSARQFLWFNRFDDPGFIRLEEIWVLFPSGTDVIAGDAVQLVVFVDSDGDPTNGADLLGTYDETVQAADGNTFSVYTLPAGLLKSTPGDILIGVVNRYFQTGVDPPPTVPAAFDSTMTQNQSYFALWAGDPPNPPNLSTATDVDLLAGITEGNFMIRGFGSPQAFPVPAADVSGLALLALLLALAGAVMVSRR